MRTSRLPLVVMALATSCATSTSPTRIVLEVSYDTRLAPTDFDVSLGTGASTKTRRLSASTRVVLVVGDSLADRPQDLAVVAFRGAARAATGRTVATPKLGQEVVARVTLARVACGEWCTKGAAECRPSGTGPNAGTSVVVCEQRDDDSCMEWSEPVGCGVATPQCALGTCVATCVDECAAGETQCAGGAAVRMCGQRDSDTCLEWLAPTTCNGAERCSSGACRATCEHECEAGALKCLGAGRSECGDLDGDGCREWSPTIACAATEECSVAGTTLGRCVPKTACSDQCTSSQCDGNTFKECGNFDLDSCKELSSGTSCAPVNTCLEGMCRVTGCATTERRCAEPPAATCLNASTLRTFDAVGVCTTGACTYNSSDRTCAGGCDAGRCRDVVDPCAGVICNRPPSSCYAATGTCTNGSCSYAFADAATCDDGNMCTDTDRCQSGVCAGTTRACNTPPAATCADANTLRTYVASGSCSSGTCSYAPTDMRCMFGCASGACLPMPTRLVRTAYVKASNTERSDVFGEAVAVSGDGSTLAVGAPLRGSTDAGAVYVFRRTGATWAQEAYVTAANADVDDAFGIAVALSYEGHVLAVGAPGEDGLARGINGPYGDLDAFNAGAAYVFRRTGSTWTQEAYVKASNSGPGEFFGTSVALSGDGNTLAVGADAESSSATGINGEQFNTSRSRAGAVYVFRNVGGAWAQEAYVKASNTGAEDYFGSAVSLSANGDTLAVGAPLEDSSVTGINGAQTDNAAENAGAVYVFSRTGSAWTQEAYVKASNTGSWDGFGSTVSLSGDGVTLAVGAYGEDSSATGVNGAQTDNAAENSGAVYVFRRIGATWIQEAYVKASNTEALDAFGSAVSLSSGGTTMVVAAGAEDSASTGIDGPQTDNAAIDSGAVFVFARAGTAWAQVAYVKASNTDARDSFGKSVALSGDGRILAVGARGEDSAATGIDGDQTDNSAGQSGAVYLFEGR